MIHPLTYIHPDAKVAPNVKIDPFTVIHKNVEIGDGTWVGSNVTIMEGARIGKNCRIFPGAVISAIPQDLKFDGEESTVEIGDNTTIREFVTVNRGTKALGKTVIGKNCLIQAYCHIAHDCQVGDYCIFSNSTTLAGHITVGDYVVLAGLVAVHQFVKIGSHSFVSGGSLVRKDVPPYVKAAREPLSYVGVNSIGLKRRGFSIDKINHILDIYRVVFVKGYSVSKAVRIIEAEFPATDERDEILSFIRDSPRGIMKGYTSRNNDDIS
ncbi:acyl-[acyl-carrier-protein]--UDP-N-acetylglucosamine O-acyltransferase [Chitinophaga costaii]|uniref:Acyl-[acyl-carrier-protein]--UDP-N-acetylglucosamine O-acyltransferase n=1 Tax=Chitinophaga costaii TaxID=1335309 RepID=A0A1C4F3R9_9BACT|nr:acyl-ACP--UDP-N-acetylglucosamine O-acyltransferase [Chitinophaga costaii]PUZ22108.1 acyl-ACP--UDP-N-acetylglucosamine O-acyltransferase [Chitinophaga costaii]SCC50303.1 acyl-[acyl-carrier-protein]--UDP-N-acetylglucosamine O-acyltransferase [Chitinophaga costaii]